MSSAPVQLLRDFMESARWRIRTWDELKSASWFTTTNYINFFVFLSFVAYAIYQARTSAKTAEKTRLDKQFLKADGFPDIDRLEGFKWATEEPLKLRAFKPKYHLTMALQKLNPSELILMDNTYSSRIAYRKQTMKDHRDITLAVNDEKCIAPAIREFYGYLMGTYLPKRYPKMFKLHEADFETGKRFMLENLISKEILPATAIPSSNTLVLLEYLGRTVDEDFLFLLPEEQTNDDVKEPKYVLEAYVTICPNGFNPKEKLGKRLADIHKPVPGYSSILQGSMDRYFTKIDVGEYVKRSNWNITTNDELFCLPGEGGNHAREGDVIEELKEIDVDNTFLRCERQTLHRLPRSKALVFAFHTYMYPIKDIQDEGLGEELAQAIDGMKEGNIPAMHVYKRGAVWGEAAKRYLRS